MQQPPPSPAHNRAGLAGTAPAHASAQDFSSFQVNFLWFSPPPPLAASSFGGRRGALGLLAAAGPRGPALSWRPNAPGVLTRPGGRPPSFVCHSLPRPASFWLGAGGGDSSQANVSGFRNGIFMCNLGRDVGR